jgi:uncharacterized protein (DUF1697 family)
MGKFVALLRGINVSGRNKVPMAELRSLAAELGWAEVETYIQSGNLVFAAGGKPAAHEAALEQAIEKSFGFAIPVIVRAASAWADYVGGNPFPEEAEREPNRLMLLLAKQKPAEGAAEALQERARDGEQVKRAREALWIHYPGGAGTSRLSPALIDRIAGSPVTARNFRTVLKLGEMLAA